MTDPRAFLDGSLSPLGAAALSTSFSLRGFRSLTELLVVAARRGVGETVLREATETLARALDAARVSVWLHEGERRVYRGADSYHRDSGRHEVPADLSAREGLSLLEPLESAPLSVPVVTRDGVVGLVRVERSPHRPPWTADEERYARAVADVLALGVDV